MRKIILMMSVSLDGFFEGPNRELDWQVVDDELRQLRRSERVITDLGLRVDEADQVMRLMLDPGDGLDAEVQHFQHRLVLGAADDPAVGGGRGHPRGVCEQVGKPTGARHGVGVRVVVRQDERAMVTLGDLEELPQPVADQELG